MGIQDKREEVKHEEYKEREGPRRGSGRLGILDVEGDFVDAGGADGVEDGDDLAVAGVFVAGDEDAEVGVGGVLLGEGCGQFVEGHGFFVEVNAAGAVDGNIEEIFFHFRGGGDGGGEIYLDGLEVDHGEAHEHEGGQEEEHDVDERDDFNSRFGVFGGEFGAEFDGHDIFQKRRDLFTTEARRHGVFLFLSPCLCVSVVRNS